MKLFFSMLGTVTGMIGAFGIMSQAGLNQPDGDHWRRG